MDGSECQLTRKAQITAASAALVAILDKPERVSLTCAGISKSKFVAGLQCVKRLYLQVHAPQLGKITDQGIKAQGKAVGVLARNLFRGGTLVEADRNHLAEAMRTTRELMNNPEIPAIFEATFRHDGVLVQVDILSRIRKAKEFQLIEVKSSTEVKPYHVHDLGIQRYVLRGVGLCVKSNHLMHVNSDYVFSGHLDLSKLFRIEEIPSDRLLTRSGISQILNTQYALLSRPEPPLIEPGTFCTHPYRCEFYEHCHPAPDQDDVRSLPIPVDKIRMLLDYGVTSISQLPTATHLKLRWHFTNLQCSRIDAFRHARRYGLWLSPNLDQQLAAIKYPVCFMDFETITPAAPRFIGMKPYEPIPVQWSVHRRESEAGKLEHYEFLWPNREDPRRAFMHTLSPALVGARNIVVYGSYEKTLLSNLVRWIPECALNVREIQSKLVDLSQIIRRHVYSLEFLGSFSIKRVLPVLVPGSSYDDLVVKSGTEVASVWEQFSTHQEGSFEHTNLGAALLRYCEKDTLALVRILAALKRLASLDKSLSINAAHHIQYGSPRLRFPTETEPQTGG